MGLHFAWNALEDALGIPVSELPAAGLFTVKANGAAWLTGEILAWMALLLR